MSLEIEASNAALASKVRLYRTLTFVFAAVGVFLAIVLVGQLTMGQTPGAAAPGPVSTADSETSADPATPQVDSADSMVVLRDPADAAAIAALRPAFPDREIVPVDCSALILQYGSLHCVTMQIPKGVLSTA